jgi:hypothetical protein
VGIFFVDLLLKLIRKAYSAALSQNRLWGKVSSPQARNTKGLWFILMALRRRQHGVSTNLYGPMP